MPKNTFFNLPEEKKDRIIEIAIDEFSEYDYHKASISRIVKKAEIAKGSFYQYFEDKKDLYKYILLTAGEKKFSYLTHLVSSFTTMDTFQILRELYSGGVIFAKENPKLAIIGNNFVKNNDANFKEEMLGESTQKSNAFLGSILAKGIAAGEVDPKIDVEFVSYILTALSMSIGEYFIKEMQTNDYNDMINLSDKMIYIIENGIAKKN